VCYCADVFNLLTFAQFGQPSSGGNLLGLAKVSRVQCLNAAGVALLGAGGKAVVLRAKENLIEHDSILCCGGITSVCDVMAKGGRSREMVFAECDASGERAWLVLQSASAAAALKPVTQVTSHHGRALCSFADQLIVCRRRGSPVAWPACLRLRMG
jgi:hypothetical protein